MLDFTGMGTLDLNVYVSDWEAMKASEGFTGLKIRFYPTDGLGDDSAIIYPHGHRELPERLEPRPG